MRANESGFVSDVSNGGVSALASTLCTNGLLHWQFCQVKGMKFRLADIWRGFGPNFVGYAGCLTAAQISKGGLNRVCDRLGYRQSDLREVVVGMLSGGFSSVFVVSSERIAALDNKLGKGSRQLVTEVWKRSGWRGFAHGITPTLFRDTFAVAGVVTGGSLLRDKLCERGINPHLATVYSSVMVGTGAVYGTQPAQVLRLVMQSSERDLSLRGAWTKLYQAKLPWPQRLRPFWGGSTARVVLNIVLVGCNILVDDRLESFQKTGKLWD